MHPFYSALLLPFAPETRSALIGCIGVRMQLLTEVYQTNDADTPHYTLINSSLLSPKQTVCK